MSWFAPKPPSRRVRVYWTKADGSDLQADGFLTGVKHGHYILEKTDLITGEHDSDALGLIEIPAKRVDFVQIITPGIVG